MKLLKKVPQTLATVCFFDDGSHGIESWQYDSLYGGLVRRDNHTLTEAQEKAVKEAGPGKNIYQEILGEPAWVREILYT